MHLLPEDPEAGERDYCAECERSLPYRGQRREPGPDFVEPSARPSTTTGRCARALMNYKFHGARGCAEAFGRLWPAASGRTSRGEYDLISWVPLSGARLRERGYDQAMLLAMAAALELGDVAVETLRKIRDAEPQSGKRGLAERRANIPALRVRRPRARARQAHPAHRRHSDHGRHGERMRAHAGPRRGGERSLRLRRPGIIYR